MALTEIDMLHVKKDEVLDNPTNLPVIKTGENSEVSITGNNTRSPEPVIDQ